MKRAPAYPGRTALLPALLILSAGLAGVARASDADLEALRAEVRPLRAINDPSEPIWVRFSLINPTDQALEFPVASAAPAAPELSLPADVLYGTAAAPAIAVGFQSERPAPLPPPASVPGAAAVRTLRLAPRSSIGAEIDLRGHFRTMRYDGVYRVEWRPLGGRMQGATADVLIERRKDAIIVTDQGKMTFALNYDSAPRNVENFLELVRTGFYDGKLFHRIVPGYLIQGGCPHGTGAGVRPDGRLLPAEFTNAPVEMGTLLMARKPTDPNSASCQFFVALARLPELDGQYTIVGRARDDESLRTMQTLSATPTTKNDRPVQSVVIRSIKLLDADARPLPTTQSTQRP